MKYFTARQQNKANPLLYLHDKTEHVYIVENYMYSKKGRHFCFCVAKIIKRTRQNVAVTYVMCIIIAYNILIY